MLSIETGDKPLPGYTKSIKKAWHFYEKDSKDSMRIKPLERSYISKTEGLNCHCRAFLTNASQFVRRLCPERWLPLSDPCIACRWTAPSLEFLPLNLLSTCLGKGQTVAERILKNGSKVKAMLQGCMV